MAALVAAILLPYTLNAQEITICPYKDGKSCAVSFTFDDGFQDGKALTLRIKGDTTFFDFNPHGGRIVF